MAQGIGYNSSFYGDNDDDITSGFGRYEEDVEHSQNLVIPGFEDDFQDPVQLGVNHQEVPHEELQLVAREESPVPLQSLQFEELDQWEYDEENRVEYQESLHQHEYSQQIQQSEDQDYQVKYPQYLDKGFLNHQQMPNVVHQQDFLEYKDLDQLEYDKENRFDYQQLDHQQQPPQQFEHSAQINYQLEYSVTNKGNQMDPRQERQMVRQQRPTQSHQMRPEQVSPKEHRVEGLPIQQTRPQQQKDRRVNPQSACSQHEIELFDAPQPQVQRTGPLFFSPLEHPLNGVSKWKNQQRNQQVLKQGSPQHFQPMKQPEIIRGSGMISQFEQQLAQQARLREAKKLLFPVSFEQEALNMKSQGSGPLKFSPMVHPITKVPYEIPQNVSQLTLPTQRVEEMEEPSQITENPRSRWNRLTEEQKKRSNIKRTENRQKKRMRDAQKAQEEKEKQANDALRKINCLKKLWPL